MTDTRPKVQQAHLPRPTQSSATSAGQELESPPGFLAPQLEKQGAAREAAKASNGADRPFDSPPPLDSRQEAANILKLQSQQSESPTPLSISSNGTRVVIGQF